MTSSVEEYLEQLKAHLAGADPATVQDALSDAEEHLRTGNAQTRRERPDLADAEAWRLVVEQFGSPEDVAAAYRELESSLPLPLSRLPRAGAAGAASRYGRSPQGTATLGPPEGEPSFAVRFFGVFLDPRAYAALFYMVISLMTGVLYFTWALTGISLSFGLIVLIIGLPFILVFLLSVHGIALVEGRMVEALLGVRMPRRPIFSSSHLGFWGRLRALTTDRLTWTAMLYLILQLPLGILYFTVFATMLSFGLAGIIYPVAQIFIDVPYIQIDEWQFYPPSWFYPILVVVGGMWILITLHLARAVGRAQGALAKSLLVRN